VVLLRARQVEVQMSRWSKIRSRISGWRSISDVLWFSSSAGRISESLGDAAGAGYSRGGVHLITDCRVLPPIVCEKSPWREMFNVAERKLRKGSLARAARLSSSERKPRNGFEGTERCCIFASGDDFICVRE
jgi:hypothetical protein